MGKRAKRPSWSVLKKHLTERTQAELLALVKDLFDRSADNRAFIAARLLAGGEDAADSWITRPYRQRIHDAFYNKGGWPRARLGLADARKAIRDYRKASGDVPGTVELMLTYVETGTNFVADFGAADGPLLDSLSSVLNEMKALLAEDEGLAVYREERERLLELAEVASRFGWGYEDHVRDVLRELDRRWADAGPP